MLASSSSGVLKSLKCFTVGRNIIGDEGLSALASAFDDGAIPTMYKATGSMDYMGFMDYDFGAFNNSGNSVPVAKAILARKYASGSAVIAKLADLDENHTLSKVRAWAVVPPSESRGQMHFVRTLVATFRQCSLFSSPILASSMCAPLAPTVFGDGVVLPDDPLRRLTSHGSCFNHGGAACSWRLCPQVRTSMRR